MKLSERLVSLFIPNDDAWFKHANPWSVWTRFATLPFIILAIWSRVWIGWYCLVPIVLLVVWIFVNPRLFPKPASFKSWGSRAVLGERVYTNQHAKPIPEHHKLPIKILNGLQTISGCILAYGLWDLHLHLTILGATSIYLSKMWFLDRMVWLYEETK